MAVDLVGKGDEAGVRKLALGPVKVGHRHDGIGLCVIGMDNHKRVLLEILNSITDIFPRRKDGFRLVIGQN